MPYLTPAEIKTHLYDQVIHTIDDTTELLHLKSAISAAMGEAYSYLSNYDRVLIFDSIGDLRNPILLLYVKDIAVWHFINLANPNVDMELRERRYKYATAWLKDVQATRATPDLPVPLPSDENPQNGSFKWGSSKRRITNY